MRDRLALAMAVMVAILLYSSVCVAEGKVAFEPVKAPARGPDDAAVTIIEIADYM